MIRTRWALALCLAGCTPPASTAPEYAETETYTAPSPPAPTIEEWANAAIDRLGEPFDRALSALDTADDAYHMIADTPMKEMDANAAAIGDLVTQARDEWRRAMSYAIDVSSLEHWVESSTMQNPSLDHRVVLVPITGHKVQLRLELWYTYVDITSYGGDASYMTAIDWALATSRGKQFGLILHLDPMDSDHLSHSFWEDHEFAVHVGQIDNEQLDPVFDELLGSDEISVPDLIANIKR